MKKGSSKKIDKKNFKVIYECSCGKKYKYETTAYQHEIMYSQDRNHIMVRID